MTTPATMAVVLHAAQLGTEVGDEVFVRVLPAIAPAAERACAQHEQQAAGGCADSDPGDHFTRQRDGERLARGGWRQQESLVEQYRF